MGFRIGTKMSFTWFVFAVIPRCFDSRHMEGLLPRVRIS